MIGSDGKRKLLRRPKRSTNEAVVPLKKKYSRPTVFETIQTGIHTIMYLHIAFGYVIWQLDILYLVECVIVG